MPDHADFLDHTGRTPREYGAVHIHAEPVVRGPSGDAVATVWLQSAFEPLLTTDSLHIVARRAGSQEEVSLKRLSLPSLAGGKVVRWRLPLSLQEDVAELLFLVESKLHPKAQRVRPTWKLLDTIEVPKESELQNSLADPLSSIALNVAGAAAITFLTGGAGAHAVRTARAAVSMLSDAARTAASEPTARAGQGRMRTCYSCGFEGLSSDYERAVSCPRCDASWY